MKGRRLHRIGNEYSVPLFPAVDQMRVERHRLDDQRQAQDLFGPGGGGEEGEQRGGERRAENSKRHAASGE